MKGLDIIEALQNIDEGMILRARLHKRTSPMWLKTVSIAACFCGILLLGVLAMNRIITADQEPQPDTLAPVETESTQEWESSLPAEEENSFYEPQETPHQEIQHPQEVTPQESPLTENGIPTIPSEDTGTAEPSPSPSPTNVVMEEDLVLENGIAMGADLGTVRELLGTPTEESTGADDSIFLRYGGQHMTFSLCSSCGLYHLTYFGQDDISDISMPLGLNCGTPLADILAKFNATDATPGLDNALYRYDSSHYVKYEPVGDTGLVSINIQAGNLYVTSCFNRQNCIYFTNIYYLGTDFPCPYGD